MIKKWQLLHNDILIAVLDVYEANQPWFHCDFSPNSGYKGHSSFFNDFQNKYSNGNIRDYDKFFGALKENNYALKHEEAEMIRFIILFNGPKNKVRLRGQIIKHSH